MMQIRNKRAEKPFLFAVIFLYMVCGVLVLPLPLSGEDTTNADGGGFNGIRVVTDRAIMDSRSRYTEFSGNVTVDIDDTTIVADWLKVSYRPGLGKDLKMSMSRNAIQEIRAKGNVRITFDDKVAVTGQAVYTPENDTLVLTGEGSKISSGDDYIAGDKIILNRGDGTFKVESSGNRKVEAVFYQDQPEQE